MAAASSKINFDTPMTIEGEIPKTAEEARTNSKELRQSGKSGDKERSDLFAEKGHNLEVKEKMEESRKGREKSADMASKLMVLTLSVPVAVVGGLHLYSAIAGLIPAGASLTPFIIRNYKPLYLVGGLMYGLLAPPGAPDLPANPADDVGRAAKVKVLEASSSSPMALFFLVKMLKT